MKYGDIGDKFYLILRGVVSVEIPNPSILDWKSKNEEYMRLKKWRETVMESKIQKAQNDPEFHHKERRMSQIVRRQSTWKNMGCLGNTCNSKIVFDPLKHIKFLKLSPEDQAKWDRFLQLD